MEMEANKRTRSELQGKAINAVKGMFEDDFTGYWRVREVVFSYLVSYNEDIDWFFSECKAMKPTKPRLSIMREIDSKFISKEHEVE